MGMFNTVLVNCPKCGKTHEFQSKSGNCTLEEYNLKECPTDVIIDVNRYSPYKCACGAVFEVDIENRKAIFTNATS